MTRMLAVPLALFASLAATPVQAQFGDLLDKVKQKAEDTVSNRAQQKTEESTNQAIDSVTSGKKPAPTPPPAKAPPPAPARSEPPAAEGAKDSAGAPTAGAKESAGAPAAVEVYSNEFDFVPGDKVLFFEDFADTAPGEYPTRWTRKGIGGGSSMEIISREGKHWLRIAKGALGSGTDYIRSEFPDLPKKFSLEFDAFIDPGVEGLFVVNESNDFVRVGPKGASTGGSSAEYPEKAGLKHVAISVSDNYLKLYVDGARVLIDADGFSRPVKRLGVSVNNPWAEGATLMFTNFRLAEGGKDYRKELVSLGRIVTHGITFDSGSDVIKPESGPTLHGILALLKEDGALRFEIQGHTDNQGTAKVNQPLSERRAAAIKSWLVKQGVGDARLRVKGLADTKPIDSNGTAEGRANNRRVEFVKVAK